MKYKKGIFKLEKNVFSKRISNKIPVNFFLMRSEENELESQKKIYPVVKSEFYNTDEMGVGDFWKSISNIL